LNNEAELARDAEISTLPGFCCLPCSHISFARVAMRGGHIQRKSRATLATDNGTVPLRATNASVRSREYLTQGEVKRLIEVAKDNRFGQRDSTMILIAFRHALRVSELVGLRWSDVDFERSTLNAQRLKGSKSGSHPIERGWESLVSIRR
jgi:integrase